MWASEFIFNGYIVECGCGTSFHIPQNRIQLFRCPECQRTGGAMISQLDLERIRKVSGLNPVAPVKPPLDEAAIH